MLCASLSHTDVVRATHGICQMVLTVQVIVFFHIATSTAEDVLLNDVPLAVRINYNSSYLVEASREGYDDWFPLPVNELGVLPIGIVVCRQLGMDPPHIWRRGNSLSTTLNVTISCDGSESSIDSCERRRASRGAVYQLQIEECLPILSNVVDDLDMVVLSRNYSDSTEGIPLVYTGGRWQPICDKSTLDDAACSQVGLGTQRYQMSHQGNGFAEIPRLQYFDCDGRDEKLYECDMHTPYSGSCRNSGSYLYISCSGAPQSEGSWILRPSTYLPILAIVVFSILLKGWKPFWAAMAGSNPDGPRATNGAPAGSTANGNTNENTNANDPPPSYPAVTNPAYQPPTLDEHLPTYEQATDTPGLSDGS